MLEVVQEGRDLGAVLDQLLQNQAPPLERLPLPQLLVGSPQLQQQEQARPGVEAVRARELAPEGAERVEPKTAGCDRRRRCVRRGRLPEILRRVRLGNPDFPGRVLGASSCFC